MAHTKSAKKRIRQNAVNKLRNRYKLSTTRSAIKRLEETSEKEAATGMLTEVVSMVDKCVKHNIFHKNKGAHIKSQLYNHIKSL